MKKKKSIEIENIFISKYKPTECEIEWVTDPPNDNSNFLIYSFTTNINYRSRYNITIPTTIKRLRFTGLKPHAQCEFKIKGKDGGAEKSLRFVTPNF